MARLIISFLMISFFAAVAMEPQTVEQLQTRIRHLEAQLQRGEGDRQAAQEELVRYGKQLKEEREKRRSREVRPSSPAGVGLQEFVMVEKIPLKVEPGVADLMSAQEVKLLHEPKSVPGAVWGSSLVVPRGWALINNSARPVYCAWYKYDEGKKVALERIEKIIQIVPNDAVFIPSPPQPGRIMDRMPRRLVVTFYGGELLARDLNLEQASAVAHFSQTDLGYPLPYAELVGPETPRWLVLDEAPGEEQAPILIPATIGATGIEESISRPITVINTTNDPLYCALYFVDRRGQALQAGLVKEIRPQLSERFEYKERKGFFTQLFIAKNKANLKAGQDVHAKGFASSNLIRWYLQGEFEILYDVMADNSLRLRVSSVGGDVYQRAARRLKDVPYEKMRARYEDDIKKGDPLFKPAPAIVAARGKDRVEATKGAKVLSMEAQFIETRSPKIRTAINQLVEQELLNEGSYVPKIALVFSGGGYRAMTQTIGYLKGAANQKDGNILDCCMYMCGLSGSTWAINPLVVSGQAPDAFARLQRGKLQKGGAGITSLNALVNNLVYPSGQYQRELMDQYMRRRFIESRFGQFHGVIGLWGHALANALLDGYLLNGKGPHDIMLSDLRGNLENGLYPLPISVAADEASSRERIWYEFNPFYIGTHTSGTGAWVDTQLFGSFFKEGVAQDVVPEYPLAQYMGTWGSAFAIAPEDIAKAGGGGLAGWLARVGAQGYQAGANALYSAYNVVLWKTPEEVHCPFRVAAGEYPNYAYLVGGVSERLTKSPRLCLIDGGISVEKTLRHNFASVPALWRQCDILIMCDSPANPNKDIASEHIRATAEEARRLGYRFPDLSSRTNNKALEVINNGAFALLVDEDPRVPIVIYMKCKKNDQYDPAFDPDADKAGFTGTLNFNYTPDQFEKITGLTEYIFMQSKPVIKEAIEVVLKRKGVAVPEAAPVPLEFLQ